MHDPDPPNFSKVAEDLIGALRRIPRENPGNQRRRPVREMAQLMGDLRVKYGIGLETPEQVIREHWTSIVGPANAAYSHASQIDPRGTPDRVHKSRHHPQRTFSSPESHRRKTAKASRMRKNP
jgi:hypothetical protein